MLGGAKRVIDPNLGELTRRGRSWRGQLPTNGGVVVQVVVQVVVPGDRSSPDADAAALIAAVLSDCERIRPLVRDALIEHRADSFPVADAARLEVPAPVHATVISLDRQPTVELGYRVDWDEEHTLGVRLRDGELVELCGSVLPP